MKPRIATALLALAAAVPAAAQVPADTSRPWLDMRQPVERRAAELVARMTLAEKVSQMMNEAAAIDRLGVPSYNWWGEALHGVARAGLATSFPQAIGLAAMWDDSLLFEIATATSTEARAKFADWQRQGNHGIYRGLTFWSPNVNLFRDPRWGRGQETYGEDPFLTGRLAVAFVRGMQGDDPRYFRTIATLKHYAVHSGPESTRHTIDVTPSRRDFHESYLPHFAAGITEGHAYSVMCAYNRVYGSPACASELLLDTMLRRTWGFRGYVVSDCDAIDDIWQRHRVAPNAAAASAMAVKAGDDLDCGDSYGALTTAVQQGLLPEALIDTAVTRLMIARFRLGLFDAPDSVPYTRIPYSVVDQPAYRALALRAAHESIVLLKNQGNMLPLSRSLRTIAVIGPNADDARLLLGNYNGAPSDTVTPLRGIRAAVPGTTRVLYARGSDVVDTSRTRGDSLLAAALDTAKQADAVVLCLGLSPRVEGEEMDVRLDGFSGGDRTRIDLPDGQQRLLERVVALRKPTVLVLLSGSAVAVPWAQQHVPAILEAWYGGQAAGTALADVLFGTVNPGGRLPVTFYQGVGQLPAFDNYDMAGRTYRFMRARPLYPFGFGLSYTTFRYANLRAFPTAPAANDTITVQFDVTNTGRVAGDEVAQLYVRHTDTQQAWPNKDLRGFRRLTLQPGETRTVTLRLPIASLAYWDEASHGWIVPTEAIELQAGASSADIRLKRSYQVTGSR